MSSSTHAAALSLLGDSGAEVAPGLFLGDKRLAANLDALQALGITHVVNATPDVRHYWEQARPGHQQIAYLRCACHDTDQADMSQHFPAACEFVSSGLSSGGSVLVHCQQGVSRSSTLLIAFLMHSRGMTVAEAYTMVRTARPVAKPKANFIRQLVKWGAQLQAEKAKRQKEEAKSNKDGDAKVQSDGATSNTHNAVVSAAAATPVAAVSAAVSAASSSIGAVSPSVSAIPPSSSAVHPPANGSILVVDVAPGLVMLQEGGPQSHNPVDEAEAQRKKQLARESAPQDASAAAAQPAAASSTAAIAAAASPSSSSSSKPAAKRKPESSPTTGVASLSLSPTPAHGATADASHTDPHASPTAGPSTLADGESEEQDMSQKRRRMVGQNTAAAAEAGTNAHTADQHTAPTQGQQAPPAAP